MRILNLWPLDLPPPFFVSLPPREQVVLLRSMIVIVVCLMLVPVIFFEVGQTLTLLFRPWHPLTGFLEENVGLEKSYDLSPTTKFSPSTSPSHNLLTTDRPDRHAVPE